MKKFLVIILLVLLGSEVRAGSIIQDSIASFDLFPLKPKLHYTYDYYSECRTTWVVELEQQLVDSGSVEYIVRDSALSGDTSMIWNIEERQILWHHVYSIYSNPQDTTFWTCDTVFFALEESMTGSHELIASGSIWRFPLSNPETTQSIHRFSDSSNALIADYWRINTPDCGGGADSIWFSDSSGLCRIKSWSLYGGCHNTHMSSHTGIRLRGNPVLSVRESASFPHEIELKQNYPNPFNPGTTISYQLPSALGGQIQVTLKVFDLLGREVATLAQEKKGQGEFSVIWNAENLPGGVYFYRLVAGDFIRTRKMVLIK